MARTISPVEDKKHNLIAAGTKIKGDLSSDGDIRIDGEITGTIQCKGKLVLGPDGRLTGEFICNTAEIMGKLSGKLIVHELLSVKSTANIDGDIKTARLAIEPNAIFSGTCDMGKSNDEPKVQIPHKK